ncbi:MAG: hypothetical protein Q8Q09_01990 [Deltaproteobacteria bacterium]|nr:hypothetical protein [Deltaproteobacteria bacterium]
MKQARRYSTTALCVATMGWALSPMWVHALVQRSAGVVSARNVELLGPQRRELAPSEQVTEGQHLRVREGGELSLAMHGGGRLTARDQADLFVYGDPSVTVPAGHTPSRDTLARRGEFVMRVGPGSRAFSLVTPAATITALSGEVLVRASANRVRFMVLSGRARVRAMGHETLVREGWGARVDFGHAAVPRPLVQGPTMTGLQPTVTAYGSATDLAVGLRTVSNTPVAQWQVELSRQADFSQIEQRRTLGAAELQTALQRVATGRVFIRARAIDTEQLEGTWGPTAAVDIVGPRVIEAAPGRLALVTLPPGMRCAMDSSPMHTLPSMVLTPGRAHQLRCERPDTHEVVTTEISAAQAGEIHHHVTVVSDTTSDMHVVSIRLSDSRGGGIPYAALRIEAPAGVQVSHVTEEAQRGVYTATVQWPHRVGAGALHVVVNDTLRFDEHMVP